MKHARFISGFSQPPDQGDVAVSRSVKPILQVEQPETEEGRTEDEEKTKAEEPEELEIEWP